METIEHLKGSKRWIKPMRFSNGFKCGCLYEQWGLYFNVVNKNQELCVCTNNISPAFFWREPRYRFWGLKRAFFLHFQSIDY